jgi:serine protease Do
MYRRLLLVFLVLAMINMACSFSIGNVDPTATTPPQQPQATDVAPVEVEVEASPTPEPEPTATVDEKPGSVRSLDDVEKAVIQIVAEGTFVDPQFGLMVNAAGSGSGFIIDPSGIAVTNNHVVTGAAMLKVYVGGETRPRNARVLGVSECSDLAVIDIDGDGYPYLDWYEGAPKVGLDVYAAGFPLGDPEFTLTRGIVSKASADGETNWASVDNVIMHDATINPGNSGGPLITTDGQVIGVNYAGARTTSQYFAIAPSEAKSVIAQLREGNDVNSLGINGQAVMSEDGTFSGIWVSSVKSGSPADKARIQAGDIITSLENIALATDGTMADYCDILRSHRPTDTLSVSVLRWSSQAFMEGQINGRELAVSMSFANELGTEVQTSSDGTYAEWVRVTDDTGSIQLEIPAEWYDVDGTIWNTDWGSYKITAPSITASADLSAYLNTWDESGVFFAASSDMGRTGGYMQLLEGVQGWYNKECRLESASNYSDELYEGRYQLWKNCGPNRTYSLVLTARPKVNKTDFLILLDVRITKDADLDAIDRILNTFVVVGDV